MSVAQILERLAENAGRRPSRGALIGQTIAQVAQVPGQILADREHARAAAIQEARQAEQLGFQRSNEARAAGDYAAQASAGQAAAAKEAALRQGIAAGFAKDPKTFDLPASIDAVTQAGFPELEKTLFDVHARRQAPPPKLTEFDPTHGSQDAQGNIVRAPVPKVEPPKLETRSLDVQAADALARGDQDTYARLMKVKKEMGQADDRPRITVNTGAGLPASQLRRVDAKSRAFEALPLVKRTVTMAEAVGFAHALDVNTKNPADDQALIYAFAKAMDPDSVVREGEYATVQKYAQTWAQNLGFKAERIFSNSAFLTVEARKNMKATIATKFGAAEKQYNAARKSYVQHIDQITGGKDGADYLTDFAGAFPTAAAPAAAAPGGMMRVVGPNGETGSMPSGNALPPGWKKEQNE